MTNITMNRQVFENLLPSFQGQKKKLAEYILEHYDDMIYMNITDLAEKADTSTSTITRFCRDLGYDKFVEFKIAITKSQTDKSTVLNENLQQGDSLEDIVDKVVASELEAIQSTRKVFDMEQFQKAIELIRKARRLDIYGFGTSGAVVNDASHKFLKIGRLNNAYVDNDMQAMSAAQLGPKDVVLAISHTGRNMALLQNVEIAKSTGAKIIALTNIASSPLKKMADVSLCTSARETAFKSDALSSRTAQLFIIDLLYVAIAYLDYDRAYDIILKGRTATNSKKIKA